MSQVRLIRGRGLPLRGSDIDTDRIIPARFLRCVTFDGLGEQVFADDRSQLDGAHPFDQPQYQGAKLLVVNRNFGCGSSREHAPQAIKRWGIEGIIGESFAEIFFGNCLAMGVPCVTASPQVIEAMQSLIEAQPGQEMLLDLTNLQVKAGDFEGQVNLDEGPRQMLIDGVWDACGQLMAQAPAIRATAAKLPYLTWK